MLLLLLALLQIWYLPKAKLKVLAFTSLLAQRAILKLESTISGIDHDHYLHFDGF